MSLKCRFENIYLIATYNECNVTFMARGTEGIYRSICREYHSDPLIFKTDQKKKSHSNINVGVAVI